MGLKNGKIEQREKVYVISAGLDCTIRKWRLQDVLKPKQTERNGKTRMLISEDQVSSIDLGMARLQKYKSRRLRG